MNTRARPWLRRVLAATTFGAMTVAGCSGQHGDGSNPAGENGPGTEAVAYAPMHRLNRTEYRNTIRDLLGSSLDPAADFPADDVSYGYDNIAAVLTVSPLQFELYEAAAEELAKEALASKERPPLSPKNILLTFPPAALGNTPTIFVMSKLLRSLVVSISERLKIIL